MTQFERLIKTTADRLITENFYPSVPRMRHELARTMGARTPSYASIDRTRKAMLEAGTFPLAGGRSVSTSQALARKGKREAQGKPAPIITKFVGPFADEARRVARLRQVYGRPSGGGKAG